jgi:hypothetical protein
VSPWVRRATSRSACLDFRQQQIGQLEQPGAGGGKAYRHGFSLKKRPAVAIFQQFDLMRQGRLRQVQQLGGTHQTAGGAQCAEGAEVAYL